MRAASTCSKVKYDYDIEEEVRVHKVYRQSDHSGCDFQTARRTKSVLIHGIATAAPEKCRAQREYMKARLEMYAQRRDFITRRHSCDLFPTMNHHQPPEDKMHAYFNLGKSLAIPTARQALQRSLIRAENIGKVVFVSSTSLGSSGIDRTLVRELPKKV